ncbi:MAG: type II toxin-antitoxin system Phd/YefM family antitoxin [Phycisphaerales bacterium]|nr:type II toxin-antitoxin system Phd/YefM family antitoxin [Phycisphaerales bacterium]
MEIINTHEAKTHLSRLLDRAAKGEEFIIAKAGKPVARLIGYREEAAARTGGQWKGLVRIGPDFDAPLPPDIAEAFGMAS